MRSLVPVRLLDRYLLRLLVIPLLIGLGVFVVIMLSEVALKLGQALVGGRVSALKIALYFLYKTPRAVSWSLPVGVLVGVAMVSTAITRNGESTAARAGGASLHRLWRPFFIVGVVGSLVSWAVEEYVVPTANQRATDVFLEMTHSQPVLRPRNDQLLRDREGRLIFIGHMDAKTNRLENVMVLTEDATGPLQSLTAAKWAEVSQDRWILRDGLTLTFDAGGEVTGQPARFEARQIRLWSALQDYYLDQRSEYDMSGRELRKAAEALEASGMDAQRMRVRLHFKYSIPFACLVFVLVAAPLGMRYAALGSFSGIVISILVVFLYNGVRSWGLAFGLVGDLPPVVAAWTQNIIFGALGAWLVARAK